MATHRRGAIERGGGGRARHHAGQCRRDRAPGAGEDAGGGDVSDRAIELCERYLDELQAGGRPDPAAYVADAGDEAGQLPGMIATYLTTHPRSDIPADEVLGLAARPELAA